ncbi:MAG: ECF transporter S component [Clostridia bacterium]|nr:ECF transporter S component [Clostridia bacterium]
MNLQNDKNTRKPSPIRQVVLSAMFLSIGLVLPFLTGQIPEIGKMLLPMYIPVLLCGLICGWKYGLAVGFVMPILRSLIFTMPVMFPEAVSMAFELATYGAVIGFTFGRAKWQCIRSLYRCMLTAMIAGRLVWGVVKALLLGFTGDALTFSAFMAGAVLNAVPGIILQLILVPAVMLALDRTHLVPFRRGEKTAAKADV